MSRLGAIFRNLQNTHRTGLITFATAGDPDIQQSENVFLTLDRVGVDILEIGVPFSDPLADGPVIQRASERALSGGMTLELSIDLVGRIRRSVTAGIVLFSYANPVFRMGLRRFMKRSADAGVDGVLVLDLPIEEAEEMRSEALSVDIDPIFLLSQTTSDARISRASAMGNGFLYGISRLGVTGARDAISADAESLVRRIRSLTDLPVAIGFGLSRPEHIIDVGRWADAAVVGSALVNVIAKSSGGEDLVNSVERYVRWLLGNNEATAIQ